MLSLYNQVSCCLFLKKVDTLIRRLRLLERAKRKWNHLERALAHLEHSAISLL